MDKIILKVNYKEGLVINIPFKDIFVLDEFTTFFENKLQLGKALVKILDLKIDESSVSSIKIIRIKDNKQIADDSLIKYMSDDFSDIENLKYMYGKFFIDDRRRIFNKKYGLYFVKHQTIDNFIKGISDRISDSDIQKAVNSYITGYSSQRNAYFNLKNTGYINNIKNNDRVTSLRNDLNSFDTENEYFAYLKNYANMGEEEYLKVMDVLAGYDSDDLRHNMINNQYGVFDGASPNYYQDDISEYRDIAMALEKLSEHRLLELIDMCEYNHNRKGIER